MQVAHVPRLVCEIEWLEEILQPRKGVDKIVNHFLSATYLGLPAPNGCGRGLAGCEQACREPSRARWNTEEYSNSEFPGTAALASGQFGLWYARSVLTVDCGWFTGESASLPSTMFAGHNSYHFDCARVCAAMFVDTFPCSTPARRSSRRSAAAIPRDLPPDRPLVPNILPLWAQLLVSTCRLQRVAVRSTCFNQSDHVPLLYESITRRRAQKICNRIDILILSAGYARDIRSIVRIKNCFNGPRVGSRFVLSVRL